MHGSSWMFVNYFCTITKLITVFNSLPLSTLKAVSRKRMMLIMSGSCSFRRSMRNEAHCERKLPMLLVRLCFLGTYIHSQGIFQGSQPFGMFNTVARHRIRSCFYQVPAILVLVNSRMIIAMLPRCSNPFQIARCLCILGFYLIELDPKKILYLNCHL